MEKKIEEYIKKITQPYKTRFWAVDYEITPILIGKIQGDGLQFIGVEPSDTRPNWYLVRIDSGIDIKSDDFDYESMLLQPIEEEHGNVDDYEEKIVKGKYLYRYLHGDKKERWSQTATDWPMLSWTCGGRWWVQKNFGIPDKSD